MRSINTSLNDPVFAFMEELIKSILFHWKRRLFSHSTSQTIVIFCVLPCWLSFFFNLERFCRYLWRQPRPPSGPGAATLGERVQHLTRRSLAIRPRSWRPWQHQMISPLYGYRDEPVRETHISWVSQRCSMCRVNKIRIGHRMEKSKSFLSEYHVA